MGFRQCLGMLFSVVSRIFTIHCFTKLGNSLYKCQGQYLEIRFNFIFCLKIVFCQLGYSPAFYETFMSLYQALSTIVNFFVFIIRDTNIKCGRNTYHISKRLVRAMKAKLFDRTPNLKSDHLPFYIGLLVLRIIFWTNFRLDNLLQGQDQGHFFFLAFIHNL